jgi:hypothetical protein
MRGGPRSHEPDLGSTSHSIVLGLGGLISRRFDQSSRIISRSFDQSSHIEPFRAVVRQTLTIAHRSLSCHSLKSISVSFGYFEIAEEV